MNPIALSSRRREEEEKEKVDIRVFWSTDVVSIKSPWIIAVGHPS